MHDHRSLSREAAYVIRDDRDLMEDDTTGDPETASPAGVSGTRNAADTCA
jgi:hypothetical protein